MIQPRKGWTTPGSARNVPPQVFLESATRRSLVNGAFALRVRSPGGLLVDGPVFDGPARRPAAPACQSAASSFFISAISAA